MKRKLLIVFAVVFAIKIAISFFMHGPFIFSDEPCVIQRALYFSQHWSFETCQNILQVDAGDPHPFYSALLSPIYLFARANIAYHIVLLINALLVSTLIFPFFGIFKRFTENDPLSLLLAFAMVFLPQIVAFDSTVMTETLFAVISIWFFYIYLLSFSSSTHGVALKAFSLFLAALAALTRPFGFIIFIAFTINELFVSKDRRDVALVYIPLTVAFAGLTMVKILPGIVGQLGSQLDALKAATNWTLVLSAFKNQIVSLAVATFAVPLLVVLAHMRKKEIFLFEKIKLFLLSFVILNVVIGAQHMFSLDGFSTDLSTRYLNVSLIFLIMITFVFLTKYRSAKIDRTSVAFGSVFLIAAFIFASYKNIKQSLNLDIGIFYDFSRSGLDNLATLRPVFFIPFLILCIVLIIFFSIRRYAILRNLLIAIFLLQSVFVTRQNLVISGFPSPVIDYFKDKSTHVLFMEPKLPPTSFRHNFISFDYWKMLVISPADIRFRFLLGVENPNDSLELPKTEINRFRQEFSYIVSTLHLNLPIKSVVSSRHSGLNTSTMYIYAL